MRTACVFARGVRVCSEDEALKRYETEAYEVVKCGVKVDGRTVHGCTCRFVGVVD